MSLPQQGRELPHGTSAVASGTWLEPLAGHWTEAAVRRLASHACIVRITVAALRGSAPREAGASMMVDSKHTVGTIGGGHLEWRAIALAREALQDATAPPIRWIDLVLGPDLGQCCGGRVELWLERLTREDIGWLSDAANRSRTGRAVTLVSEMRGCTVTHRLLPSLPGARLHLVRGTSQDLTLFEPLHHPRPAIYIFGAGHVGQALVRLLAELALFDITWIDPRADVLPEYSPPGVRTVVSEPATLPARSAPSGTRFVVMTHDHVLDFELCREILLRKDACWLGLIGSASKSARFRSRLRREGLPLTALSRLHCPIGAPRISSKLPAALAIVIAAQLLQAKDGTTVEAMDLASCATVGACESCGEKR